MVTRPGTLEERRAQRAAPATPTDTGPAFFVGLAADGPIDAATRVTTVDEYIDTYGDDSSTAATLAHSVEAALYEGAPSVTVARVDDADTVVDADWAAALALFTKSLGPGQVAAPGRTGATAVGQLLTHAAANNRTPLVGSAFEDTVAEVTTAVGLLDELPNNERAGMFAQWLKVPDVADFGTAGVARWVPPEAIVAGLCGRIDGAENRQPNHERGRTRFATAADKVITDADRTALYTAGVNSFIDDGLGLRLDGFRSFTTDAAWFDLAHQRLFMAVEAQARAIGLRYLGERITQATINQYDAELDGYLKGIFESGALYGTEREAYEVRTGDPINTADTAAARELNAELYIRAAEHADLVRSILVKVPVNATVAA